MNQDFTATTASINEIYDTLASTMPPPDALADDWHALAFGVRRSIRYHVRRRLFFERWAAFSSVVGLLSGSVAFTSASGALLGAHAPLVTQISTALVAVVSAVTLAVGPGRKAWDHAELAKRFTRLEKDMAACTPTAANLARLQGERLDIEMTEPPVLHVLNAICHNELARAMGYGPEQMAHIGWGQRLFAQFFDVREHALR